MQLYFCVHKCSCKQYYVVITTWFLQSSFQIKHKLNIASELVAPSPVKKKKNSFACPLPSTSSTTVYRMTTEVKYLHLHVFWWGYTNINWPIKRLGLSIRLLGTLQHALHTAFWYAENFSIWQLCGLGGVIYCKFCCISRRDWKIYCHVI